MIKKNKMMMKTETNRGFTAPPSGSEDFNRKHYEV